uniref:uncharacterized protein isoform X2 n=1 Tax=Myxine glutinosa TaxID=7769 RepID=UPI00358DFDFD
MSNQTETTGSSNGSDDARENSSPAPDVDLDRKPRKEKEGATRFVLSKTVDQAGPEKGSKSIRTDARENTASAPGVDLDRKPRKEKEEATSKTGDQAGPEKGSKSVRKAFHWIQNGNSDCSSLVPLYLQSRTAEMEHLHSSFSAAAFGGKAQATFSASRKRRISSSTPKHGFVQQGQPDWNFLTSSLASDLTGAVPRWDVSSVLPTLCEEDLTSGAMVEGGDSNEIPKVKTSAAPITEEDLRLLHTDYLMARYAEMQMEDLSQRMKNEMRSAMVDVWQQKQEALAEKHRLELLLQRIKQEQQQTTTLNIEKALLIEQVKSLKGGFITSFTECGRALETASHSLPTRNLHGSEEPGYTELLKEQLNAVMNESEQLKDELSSHLSGLQPVTTAASQLRQTTSLLVAEISGLQDCQQQLNDLVLEEASLLLQQEELPE